MKDLTLITLKTFIFTTWIDWLMDWMIKEEGWGGEIQQWKAFNFSKFCDKSERRLLTGD